MEVRLNLQALKKWVTESTTGHLFHGKTLESWIQEMLDQQDPIQAERIVYRGHTPDSKEILPYSWFSTSLSEQKVRKHHLSKHCCLFKIHLLPGIKIIDVNQTLGSTGYEEEEEILVNSGGVFYKNSSLTEKGFLEKGEIRGVEVFETWYSPPKRKINANILFERIPKEEYEFITNESNIDLHTLLSPKEELKNDSVLTELIQKIQSLKGGRRSSTRRRLRLKRRSQQTRRNVRLFRRNKSR